MNNDFDERMAFYVQHHSVISEWTQLEQDWRGRISKFLKSQAGKLRDNAPDSSQIVDYPNENHAKIFLHNPNWDPKYRLEIRSQHRYPFAAIGIEWVETQLDVLSTGQPHRNNATAPYCGVFVMHKTQPGEHRHPDQFRELLNIEMKQHESLALKYNEKSNSNWWPLRRHLVFDKTALESSENQRPDIQSFLDGIETVVQGTLQEAWHDLHGIVDKVLSNLDSRNP